MTAITTATAMLDAAVTTALEHEKSLFLARNADKCAHLLVRYRPGPGETHLVITASFTLDEVRKWNQVEATVALIPPPEDASYGQRVSTAFSRLDEGIATARIARLFAPLTTEQREAYGRE